MAIVAITGRLTRRLGGKAGYDSRFSAGSPHERSDMRDNFGGKDPGCRFAHPGYACSAHVAFQRVAAPTRLPEANRIRACAAIMRKALPAPRQRHCSGAGSSRRSAKTNSVTAIIAKT
jgi:hypothetical protein